MSLASVIKNVLGGKDCWVKTAAEEDCYNNATVSRTAVEDFHVLDSAWNLYEQTTGIDDSRGCLIAERDADGMSVRTMGTAAHGQAGCPELDGVQVSSHSVGSFGHMTPRLLEFHSTDCMMALPAKSLGLCKMLPGVDETAVLASWGAETRQAEADRHCPGLGGSVF